MDAGDLKVVETELDAQIRQIEAVYDRIEQRAGIEVLSGTEGVAYQVHNF